MISIKIVNNSNNKTPSIATQGAAGADIRAFIKNKIILKPMERKLISTGLRMEIPFGYEVQIRPRSGLAFKNGITVINSPGTIDSDYRGEISVILINHGKKNFLIDPGMRIAQLVITPISKCIFVEEKINTFETKRGDNGFGSTGIKT